jgi:hypothetical protein
LSIVGKHWLILDTPSTSARQWRPLSNRIFATPLLGFSQLSNASRIMPTKESLRGRAGQLPDNVELMTLQVSQFPIVCVYVVMVDDGIHWCDDMVFLKVMTSQPGSTLVRLAHLYGVGEDDTLSKPATVSLTNLFSGFTVCYVVLHSYLNICLRCSHCCIIKNR